MGTEAHTSEEIAPALLAEVEAMAAAEHRGPSEVLRDAIALYRRNRSAAGAPPAETPPSLDERKRAAREAGERIRERRKFHPMPEGETIKSLIAFGRA